MVTRLLEEDFSLPDEDDPSNTGGDWTFPLFRTGLPPALKGECESPSPSSFSSDDEVHSNLSTCPRQPDYTSHTPHLTSSLGQGKPFLVPPSHEAL